MNNFDGKKPIVREISLAYNDAKLQFMARPAVFLLLWVVLALAPQLILGFVLQKPMYDAAERSISLYYDTVTNPVSPENAGGRIDWSEEDKNIIYKGLTAIAVFLIIMSFSAVYLGSVLASIVKGFRKGRFPKPLGMFAEGLKIFPGFFKSVFFTFLKMLIYLIPGYILGVFAGMFSGNLATVPVAVISVFFLAGFFRYGLAPFIFLVLDTTPSESLKLSRYYYKTNKFLVLTLFLAIVFFPLIFVGLLGGLLTRPGVFIDGILIVLSLLRSFVIFNAAVVYINFAFNTFENPQESRAAVPSGEEEKEE